MLQIMLMILKILGTIILVLLGILLMLLIIILVVPVRYRLSVQWKDDLYLNGTVSWFLHILHTRISIEKAKPHIIIRIFGFVFYDSERPRKPRRKRRHKAKKERIRKRTVRKTEATKDSATTKVTKIDKKTIINTETDNTKINNTAEVKTEKIVDQKLLEKNITIDINEAETINKRDRKGNRENLETADNNITKNREPFWERIITKIRGFFKNITEFFKNLVNIIKSLFLSILDRKQKSSLILEFIRDKLNQDGFRFTLSYLKKLLKHILPTKLKASILYGTGDPCLTGQILGVLGLLYGYYGDKFQVTPDFENRRLEGSLDAKGRIRLITILIIVIKLMFDRRFKQLKSNFITLKEAL